MEQVWADKSDLPSDKDGEWDIRMLGLRLVNIPPPKNGLGGGKYCFITATIGSNDCRYKYRRIENTI